ncbi:autotransporter outer membrane beta-barrel domain-containing protein [Phascolarctobacterium sp.]|uniref:autotransporter family protein n=1 Tax=Phascolarctobacterium sp. TaxID=2049039 RepID=UPI00386BF27F
MTGGDLSKDPSWNGINPTDILIHNMNGKVSPPLAGGYVQILGISNLDLDVPPSSLPSSVNKVNLNSTLIHEMGHALGISVDHRHISQFNHVLFDNSYTQHLYDANGKKYQDIPGGMIITYYETEKDLPDRFYTTKETDYSGAYFYGEHVADVLNGAKLVNEDTGYVGADGSAVGIPINGYEGMDVPELSHISLRNGLMSHFDYRNWTTFMEAELALLQDLGYDMDRRNFFGYSVYNSGADIVNNNGYSARNDAGTEYIDAPNQTAYGIGLHVYGDDNKITQKGSINTEGYGAIGVRIDGFRNKVNVDAYVKSNGVNGTGIWVAYGAEHELTVNGNVQALGQNGVGLRFDFGGNVLGNEYKYHGSYLGNSPIYAEFQPVSEDLVNPLLNTVNINGYVMGSKDAIYISGNAYVKEININSSANIYGSITSEWRHLDEANEGLDEDAVWRVGLIYGPYENLNTALNFIGEHVYQYPITGQDNLNLNVQDGKLIFTNSAKVFNVNVVQNATLLGGDYKLFWGTEYEDEDGEFVSVEPCTFHSAGTIGAITPHDADTSLKITGSLELTEGSKVQFTANRDLVGDIKVYSQRDAEGKIVGGEVIGSDDAVLVIDPNGVYTPDKLYATEIITSFKENEDGSITTKKFAPLITEATTSYQSGFLKATAYVDNTMQAAYSSSAQANNSALQFVYSDNLGERNSVQETMRSLLETARQNNSALNEAYAPLYSMQAGEAKAALGQAYGQLASDAVNIIKQDRFLSDITEERLANSNVREGEGQLWAVSRKSWQKLSDKDTLGETSANSFYTAIGSDRNIREDLRLGALASYGRHNIHATGGKSEVDDVRLGLYGRYGEAKAVHLGGYAALGWQRYDSKRNTMNGTAKGKYNSDTFSVGVKLGKDYQVSETWSLTPYFGMDYTNINLHGYRENGALGFNQRLHSQSDDVTSFTAGLEAKRDFVSGSLRIGAGYRHILSGEDVPLAVSLADASGTGYTLSGNAYAKDIYTLKLSGDAQLARNLTVSGDVQKAFGSGYKDVSLSVQAQWSF